MSKRRTESILHELSSYIPERNKEEIIEMRAQHVISSALYLFEMIDNEFTEEEADQLKKRFLSSIKGKDAKRFSRSIKKIKEDDKG